MISELLIMKSTLLISARGMRLREEEITNLKCPTLIRRSVVIS